MSSRSHGSIWLTLIAVRTLIEALLLFLLAMGLGHLMRHGVAQTLEHWSGAVGVDPANRLVQKLIASLVGVSPTKMKALQAGTIAYGLLFIVEGTGLLLEKHWAEWVTVITTAGFLPLEAYDLAKHFSWIDVVVGLGNLAVVIYLVARLMHPGKEKQS